MKKIWSKLLFVVCLSVFLGLLFLFFGIFAPEIKVYASLVHGMSLCFREGQIPCRYNTFTTLFGSAIYNYIAPLPYLVGVGVYSLVGNLSLAVKVMYALPLIVGMSSVYVLLKHSRGRVMAMIISLLFTTVAALVFIWVLKLQIGLFWTVSFLPALTFVLWRFRQEANFANGLIMSGGIALLLLMYRENLGLVILGVVVSSIYFLRSKLNITVAVNALIAFLLAIGLSCFYWLPSFIEQPMVRFENKGLEAIPATAISWPLVSSRPDWQILTGEARVSNFEKGTDWFRFNIRVTDHTIVRVPIYYFPDWVVKSGGTELINYYKNNDLGLITLILGEGQMQVWGELENTPVRVLSNLVSGVSLFLYAVFLIVEFGGIKKALKYYAKSIRQ